MPFPHDTLDDRTERWPVDPPQFVPTVAGPGAEPRWSASPGYEPVGPWPPPLPPAGPTRDPAPRGHRVLLVVGIVVLLVVGTLLGVGTRALTSLGAAPAAPAAPRGGAAASPTKPSSWAEVTAVVEPGVVNILSRMPGGIGAGTGMVLSDSGQILTNNHVVDDATQIRVTRVTTGETFTATVVGADAQQDVAVLQVDGASGWETIPVGNSDDVAVGDAVAAIGNAGGQGGEPTVAPGTVIALHRTITASDPNGGRAERLTDTIQVDADVESGESGGPLAAADGTVVGMTTAASDGPTRSSANEGYAIPINKALAIADQLDDEGGAGGSGGSSGTPSPSPSTPTPATDRGYLGVQAQTSGSGAQIVGVQTDSPAAELGLRAGDVIVAIDDEPITSVDDLTAVLSERQPGDQVAVTWENGRGRTRQAVAELAAA